MSDTATADGLNPCYKPTRLTIWQRMGFGTCSASRFDHLDDDPDWAPGHFIVRAVGRLTWKERFMVLVSGNIMMETSVKTDVPIARSQSAGAFSILPPGKRALEIL